MEQSNNEKFLRLIIKQLLSSLFLGTFPLLLLYSFSSGRSELRKLAESLSTDIIMQWYYIVITLIYVIFVYIDKHISINSKSTKTIVVTLKEILDEVASGIKSIIKAFVGLIIGFLILWAMVEPQTITIGTMLFFLICGILFLAVATYIEIGHKKLKE